MNTKKEKDSYVNLRNETLKSKCVYVTKPKKIFAVQIDKTEEFIDDKTGEKFIGIPGDYRIIDSKGRMFYMNKYEFGSRFIADNSYSLESEVFQI